MKPRYQTSLKPPQRIGYRIGEPYHEARARYRQRWDAYLDALCMFTCETETPEKNRRQLQAFWGITLGELAEMEE